MIIKNARVIDPWQNIDKIADIQIKDGKINKIARDLTDDKEIIDAKNLIACPGLVDVHVHFRDPGFTYKEDLYSGTQAAIAGGYTSVVCMANTNPVMDSPEKVKEFYKRAKELPINVYTVSALTENFEDNKLVDMEKLLQEGAVGFTDDGIPNRNSKLILQAMKEAKRLNTLISFHEEDPNLIENNGINHGEVSEKFNIYGSPSLAESSFIARDVEYAINTGAKIDIQHISTKRGVDLVRYGKSRGANVFAEVTPHHFTLTDKALLKYKQMAKMNPPLRTKEDRQAILEGIKDGTLEIIATDHAPHSQEEKNRELTKAPSGIIGLETALGLGVRELVEKNIISINKLIELMSTNPCKKYNLPGGTLKEGSRADILIFDPKREYSIETFKSKSSNTPFKGEKLIGKVIYTISKGHIIYMNKNWQKSYKMANLSKKLV